jgi:hypothetical protein
MFRKLRFQMIANSLSIVIGSTLGFGLALPLLSVKRFESK